MKGEKASFLLVIPPRYRVTISEYIYSALGSLIFGVIITLLVLPQFQALGSAEAGSGTGGWVLVLLVTT